jgi:acetyl-CoA carboxylase carboxyltransferase component
MSTASPSASNSPTPGAAPSLRDHVAEFLKIEAKIKLGGGKSAIDRQHEKGRLTARERIASLVDPVKNTGGTPVPPGPEGSAAAFDPAAPIANFTELGLWAAYEMYAEHGGAPGAGVVTGVGLIHGRPWMIIANDATVKAGAFFPMTCKKIIRAQTMAQMARLPLVYLVDSAGVFLPLQEDVFPDTDDFGRIFRNNAVLSAEGIPQVAAIMGYCVAGGGYLPVLCDTLLMTEGSGLYLAGPALVKAAIGQVVTDEELGGAKMHAGISGTIDFREKDDESCLRRLRGVIAKHAPAQFVAPLASLSRLQHSIMARWMELRDDDAVRHSPEIFKELHRRSELATSDSERAAISNELAKKSIEKEKARKEVERLAEDMDSPFRIAEIFEQLGLGEAISLESRRRPPAFKDADSVYTTFSDKPGSQYEVRDIITVIVDSRNDSGVLAPDFDEYKPEYGPSIVCGYARLSGLAIGIVANQKKLTKTGANAVQLPGVIYHDSADKAARFIMDCNQRKIPIVFLHDTTGFMVGKESEHAGIIRAGAKMVNAMSNCVVPKIVVIIGGSYGAGNYAMCGRAFDPFISLAWPSGKCAVMGANQATGVLTTIEEASRKRKGEAIDEESHKQIYAAIHASYTEQADIRHAASRGWVDRIIEPHKTREELIAALEMTTGWDYSKPFRTGVLQT